MQLFALYKAFASLLSEIHRDVSLNWYRRSPDFEYEKARARAWEIFHLWLVFRMTLSIVALAYETIASLLVQKAFITYPVISLLPLAILASLTYLLYLASAIFGLLFDAYVLLALARRLVISRILKL